MRIAQLLAFSFMFRRLARWLLRRHEALEVFVEVLDDGEARGNAAPSCSPTSYKVQMCGCVNCEIARARGQSVRAR